MLELPDLLSVGQGKSIVAGAPSREIACLSEIQMIQEG